MPAPDLTKEGLFLASGPTTGYDGAVTARYTAGGKPLPSPLPVPPGWAVDAAGPASVVYRQLPPAPTPVVPRPPYTPPPRPPVTPPVTPGVTGLPPVQRIVVPANARAFGLNSYNHVADQLIESVQYEGAEQNSAQNSQGGYTFRNYRAIGSYSDTWNLGQGLYLSGIKGKVVIDGAVLAFNGHPEDQPNYTPSGKRHGIYCNADVGELEANHVLVVRNACAGLQTRNGGDEYDVFSFGNSLPLLNVMGKLNVRRATIVAPSMHHDGTNWAGGSALYALWPVTLDDVWVIGMDGQYATPTSKPGGSYPSPAVNTGGTWSNDSHPVWTPPPAGPLITATNCVLSGRWAGGTFGGATPHSGDGFALAPNNVPASLGAQILSIYRRIVSPTPDLSIVDGLNLLHSLARSACVTANPTLAPLPH